MGLAVDQWRALIALGRAPGRTALARVRKGRTALLGAGLWERARDCDFYAGLLLESPPLLAAVHFGTPYPAFRLRVEQEIGSRKLGALPPHYDWDPAGFRASRANSAPPAEVICVADGANTRSDALLKPGTLPQRALRALSLDFYRPPNTPELHERIYPGSTFDPDLSPLRVHQALWRLRRWLERNRIPATIAETAGLYRLEAGTGFAVRVLRSEESNDTRLTRRMELLTRRYAQASFSASAAAKTLGCSHPSAVRHLREAVGRGYVTRKGNGPSTVYLVKSRA